MSSRLAVPLAVASFVLFALGVVAAVQPKTKTVGKPTATPTAQQITSASPTLGSPITSPTVGAAGSPTAIALGSPTAARTEQATESPAPAVQETPTPAMTGPEGIESLWWLGAFPLFGGLALLRALRRPA
jgi:hypothetical protein